MSKKDKLKIPRVPREVGMDLDARIEAVREAVPEAFAEGKVDCAKLKEALGDFVDERPERYSFTWAGKRDAIRLAQTPTRATLVPVLDESVDWDNTKNVFIEGENLETLKLLLKPYYGRVKMIYIDPPYNTGNDFVYPDNYADPLALYLKMTAQRDNDGDLISTNTDTSGRFHSAWLSMVLPRLLLARPLLADNGAIFVSIDDHEVHNLRLLMNDVFGEENFVAQIVWQKKYAASNDAKGIAVMHDYILVYQRSDSFARRLLPRTDSANKPYKFTDEDGKGPWRSDNLLVKSYSEKYVFGITNPVTGKVYYPPKGSCWRASEETVAKWVKEKRIFFGKDGKGAPQLKRYLNEVQPGVVPTTWWSFQEAGHNDEANKEMRTLFQEKSPFDTPKPTRLIRRMLEISTSPDDEEYVLDFFAGSGSTADAVLQQNEQDSGQRKFLLVQMPESTGRDDYPTISAITKERIRRAIKKIKDNKQSNLKLAGNTAYEDLGFRVYKLAESNLRQWPAPITGETTAEEYQATLDDFGDPILPGAKPEDVIWEVAIKEGFSLSSKIENVEGLGKANVFKVSDEKEQYDTTTGERTTFTQSFFICLDDKFSLDTAHKLKLERKRKDGSEGDKLIVRDTALDDTTAANLALQCNLKRI